MTEAKCQNEIDAEKRFASELESLIEALSDPRRCACCRDTRENAMRPAYTHFLEMTKGGVSPGLIAMHAMTTAMHVVAAAIIAATPDDKVRAEGAAMAGSEFMAMLGQQLGLETSVEYLGHPVATAPTSEKVH